MTDQKNQDMLEATQLSVSVGPALIIRESSLTVDPGQIVGLIGANGAGKTTCLRAIMGLIVPTSGVVMFEGVEITNTPAYERANRGIGYMPEDRRLVPAQTAEENILTPVWSIDIPNWQDRLAWIYRLMPEVEGLKDRPATSISGGQQKLVALARALMLGKKLLLLDEPSEGIAPVLARRIIDILVKLKSEGVSALVAESNAHDFQDILDKKFIMERGSISGDAFSTHWH
ncbi:MAG: ATP-binding cassette domain-containing protein [Aestuariivita sp.]|nr:ATP-binding cassette domain-containing protein [Aestuariivita sp.]MCY4203402.1 ATP-binding cassette domain-containing protein [Aestuariivita sp.]MCY4288330.1 ATP-binding cassette domain-containing protein [Aestuariivita sp.]MCY4345656.1 ATP-binding cassette domain-containing protein [Aestuariivita sp.]